MTTSPSGDQDAGARLRDLEAMLDAITDYAIVRLDPARQTGRSVFEGWRVRKGGERFWASSILTPIRDADGSVTGFAKIVQDLTVGRRTETLFNAVLESAPD